MSQLYRQAALDHISSPEQLDRTIIITPLRLWLSLIGAAIICVSALLWSIYGRMPIMIKGDGVYINQDGSGIIYAEKSGVVSSVTALNGDLIEVGDRILNFSDQELMQSLSELDKRVSAVEAVTFDSVGDVATADNKPLLDLKTQKITNVASQRTNTIALETRREQLQEQQRVVDELQNTMNVAGEEYFEVLDDDHTTSYNLRMQLAGNELQMYQSELAQVQSEAKALYQQIIQLGFNPDNPNDPPMPEELKNQLSSMQTRLRSKQSDFDDAQEKYEKTQKAYKREVDSVDNQRSDNAVLSDSYSRAQNEYSAARSLYNSLSEGVTQLEMQVVADEINHNLQTESVQKQFADAKSSILLQLQREQDQIKRQIKENGVSASTAGTLFELSVEPGTVISAGSPIATLRYGNPNDMTFILYVPVAEGKKIQDGMEVQLYPSTVNRQEYGHIKAIVRSVDSYVVSQTQMRAQLGSDALVNAFAQKGPVVAVTCEAMTDPASLSGLLWSNKKGSTVSLSSGTMISANIITEEKVPITMLVPYLKDTFSVDVDEEEEN